MAAGSWERADLRRGHERVMTLIRGMDDGRKGRLQRLGFSEAEAADLSGLHTRNFMSPPPVPWEIGDARAGCRAPGPFQGERFLLPFAGFSRSGRTRRGGVPLERVGRAAAAVVIGAVMAATASGVCAAAAPAGRPAGERSPAAGPALKSNVALVVDEAQGRTLYAKNPDQVAPIASITKLMTAMVVLDAALPPDEPLAIERADVDVVKRTRSRLPVGARLRRGDLLWVALMSSDNRAAAALARTYPGGTAACVEAMNRKARELGMLQTRFADPTGLSSGNVSSGEDLFRMVTAAARYPAIREATTSASHSVTLPGGRLLEFHNSNGLVSNKTWNIGLSKTGYINEAGRCLVMLAEIAARRVVIVLLDSWGKYTRLGDANRIRRWMESTLSPQEAAHGAAQRVPARGSTARVAGSK